MKTLGKISGLAWLAGILVLHTPSASVHADQDKFVEDWGWGAGSANAIFTTPVGGPNALEAPGFYTEPSVRVSMTVDPIHAKTRIGQAVVLPMEMTAGTSLGSQKIELTRARATALRMIFSRPIPVDILSLYRNMDRGVEFGVDLIGFRVPIRVTQDGEIVILPGMEIGVRHYAAPVDATAFHASFVMEGRAAKRIVGDWLNAGIIGRVRYDWDKTEASGLEEGAMGYLSMLLDRDHNLYARFYVGLEHQSSRKALELPTVNAFTGLGIHGNFTRSR